MMYFLNLSYNVTFSLHIKLNKVDSKKKILYVIIYRYIMYRNIQELWKANMCYTDIVTNV